MKILLDMGVSCLQVRGYVFLTYVLQTAAVAFGLPCCAGVSAVEDEPMMGLASELLGESGCEVAFYGFDSCAFGETKSA